MIKFSCKHCGQMIVAPDKYADKLVRCRECREPVKVPQQHNSVKPGHSKLIKFHCPNCDQKIGIASRYAGRKAKCSKCHKPLTKPIPEKTIAHPKPVPAPVASSDDPLSSFSWEDDLLSSALSADSNAKPTATKTKELVINCPKCKTENSVNNVICSNCQNLLGGYV